MLLPVPHRVFFSVRGNGVRSLFAEAPFHPAGVDSPRTTLLIAHLSDLPVLLVIFTRPDTAGVGSPRRPSIFCTIALLVNTGTLERNPKDPGGTLMSRFTSALCGMALLTAGSAALAAEPLKLADHQLDAITAGAEVGAFVAASVAVDGQAFPYSDSRTDTGPLNREIAVGSPNGVAEAQISGRVTVNGVGSLKIALGVFVGQTRTEGNGQALVSAGTVIEGGDPVVDITRTFSYLGKTQVFTVAAVRN